jgi:sulfite exporter TauE/SafE
MEFVMVFWQGFLLGLSNGVFCLASCAPALVPTLLAEERRERWVPWRQLVMFLTGRLLAYLAVGGIAGYVGMRWGHGFPQWVFGLAWVLLSGLIVLQAFAGRRGFRKRSPAAWNKLQSSISTFPFFFGLLLGLAPCLPFGLALTAALEQGRPLDGLGLFAAFYLSTSLFLLPLGFLGRFARHPAVRQVARWTAVLIGAFFLLLGLERFLG